MLIALIILIILVCLLLGLIVLIQNPKGGGLSSSFGGVGNQIFGASKSSDFVEKATWFLGGTLMALCLISGFFYNGSSTDNTINDAAPRSYEERINESYNFPTTGNANQAVQQGAQTQQQPAAAQQQVPEEE